MYPVSFVHDRNDQVQQWPLLPTAWMVPHDQREQLWIRLMVDMAPAKVSESEGSWAGKGRPYSVGFWCPRHWGEEEIWRSSLIISPPLGWLWTGSLIGCCEMNNAMPVNLTDTSFIIFILKSVAVSHSFLQIIICQWLVKILLASLVAHSFSGKERIRLPRRRPGSDPWVGKIPWRRKWWPTPAFLPAESHGQRSLGAYSHGVSKESEVTWQLKNNSEDPLYH